MKCTYIKEIYKYMLFSKNAAQYCLLRTLWLRIEVNTSKKVLKSIPLIPPWWWQDLPSIEDNTFNTFPAFSGLGVQMSIWTFLKSKKAFSGKNSSKSKGAIYENLSPLFLFRRRDKGKNKSGIIKNIPKSSSGSGFHSTTLNFIAAIRKSMNKKFRKMAKNARYWSQ